MEGDTDRRDRHKFHEDILDNLLGCFGGPAISRTETLLASRSGAFRTALTGRLAFHAVLCMLYVVSHLLSSENFIGNGRLAHFGRWGQGAGNILTWWRKGGYTNKVMGKKLRERVVFAPPKTVRTFGDGGRVFSGSVCHFPMIS